MDGRKGLGVKSVEEPRLVFHHKPNDSRRRVHPLLVLRLCVAGGFHARSPYWSHGYIRSEHPIPATELHNYDSWPEHPLEAVFASATRLRRSARSKSRRLHKRTGRSFPFLTQLRTVCGLTFSAFATA